MKTHTNISTLQDVPATLRPLVRAVMRRDELDAFTVWYDYVLPALSELNAALDSGDPLNDVDFMQTHFGLEPDYFIDLLTYIQ